MKIKLINYGYKHAPSRKHYNDAGADVYATDDVEMKAHNTYMIPLGFGLEIPDGYVGLILPRSSMAKDGIVCNIPPIDSGYRGEISAVVTNNTDYACTIKEGDRIGQLVILPVVLADYVEDLGEERGDGAFGSTGRADE